MFVFKGQNLNPPDQPTVPTPALFCILGRAPVPPDRKIIKMQLFSQRRAGDPSLFPPFVQTPKLSFFRVMERGAQTRTRSVANLPRETDRVRQDAVVRSSRVRVILCAQGDVLIKTSVHNKACPHEQGTILFHYA